MSAPSVVMPGLPGARVWPPTTMALGKTAIVSRILLAREEVVVEGG